MRIATVEKVIAVSNHTNADNLAVATILGWDVVCKKSECSVNDLVAYVNIDSVVEPHPYFKFLEAKSYRIRPIKIRGVLSQGLLIPLSELRSFGCDVDNFYEGQDISSIIKASHYEKKVPSKMIGNTKGSFPKFLIRTDEDNLRNYPNALKEIHDSEIYITQKIDGCSATYFVKSGLFGVCSRSLELQPDENAFWSIVKKFDLAYKMQNLGSDIAIQGELYGPNIQGNPTGANQISFAAYNIFFIKERRFGSLDELTEICQSLEIPQTKVIYRGPMSHSLGDFIGLANSQLYENQKTGEGIVIRTVQPVRSKIMGKDRWSAKVLNESYDR